MKDLIRRSALEIINSFPGDVVVDLEGLACKTRYGIVSPGEPGYQPLYIKEDRYDLAKLDEMLVQGGRAKRVPSEAERRAAQNGSMFGWHVPGADPLNCEEE